MRDTSLQQMTELEIEAPLARLEETDDWSTMSSVKGQTADVNLNLDNKTAQETPIKNITTPTIVDETGSAADTFTETFSGSLEDLVNTFDDKITRCFCNYDESVEQLAPVQVRSQEEIMNECQMWWTITGNFGNILPIDWSKSYARKLHMPALNLNQTTGGGGGRRGGGEEGGPGLRTDSSSGGGGGGSGRVLGGGEESEELSSEDEAVASDLDMHSLILSGFTQQEPLKTAEEVIREIDDIMEETSSECSPETECPDERKNKQLLYSPLFHDKLKTLSVSQLNELYLELELLIRDYSETLISELALRDELEYEKELKNTFISLLLAVQNKRRQHHVGKKRSKAAAGPKSSSPDSKYLTTVIPYHMESGPPNNHALQVLIKILKAINEDSPTVPTLLTDYILKVLCPT